MTEKITLQANKGKQLVIEVDGQRFYRYAIKTHFVQMGEDYIELVKKYAVPHYREGDILSIGEKVLALCQGDVILKENMKVSRLAKLLSRFAFRNPAGPAMDNVYKMQAAINIAGPIRILFAAIMSAITKLFGIKGVFYAIAGNGVRNIDGFCVVGFEYYSDKGILAPSNPDKACQDIKDTLGIDCMVVDANDLSVQILGTNKEIPYSRDTLAKLIGDNPSGQGNQQTPLILIRKVHQNDEQAVTA
ncbi:MAG: F420-0--gamma-glutamyl ligase [Mahellales bacterium]|jgi:F420-0:gamma-glutamyl ligase